MSNKIRKTLPRDTKCLNTLRTYSTDSGRVQYCTNNCFFYFWLLILMSLSPKSFIHDFFFACWFIVSFSITFFLFFFANMTSFVKLRVCFQILGCIFVNELLLYRVMKTHTVCSRRLVPCPLIEVTKFHGKCVFKTLCRCLDHSEG